MIHATVLTTTQMAYFHRCSLSLKELVREGPHINSPTRKQNLLLDYKCLKILSCEDERHVMYAYLHNIRHLHDNVSYTNNSGHPMMCETIVHILHALNKSFGSDLMLIFQYHEKRLQWTLRVFSQLSMITYGLKI